MMEHRRRQKPRHKRLTKKNKKTLSTLLVLKQQVHCGLSFDQHDLSHSVLDVGNAAGDFLLSHWRGGLQQCSAATWLAGKTQDLEITEQLNRRNEVFKQSIISWCANRECWVWKVRHAFSDESTLADLK